ncbi:MAG: sarcosine oxidase subunit gamma family protein [Motiliproteus sp.]
MLDGAMTMPNAKRSSVITAKQARQAASLQQIVLADLSFRGKYILWGNAADNAFNESVSGSLGLDLPTRSGGVTEAGAFSAIWANPKRWYLICEQADEPKLAEALANSGQVHMSVTDGQCCFRITGEATIDVLKKGCSMNFNEDSFAAGQCQQTRLAITKVFLHRSSASSFDIYVERSYGEFIWDWLVDAAQEFQN